MYKCASSSLSVVVIMSWPGVDSLGDNKPLCDEQLQKIRELHTFLVQEMNTESLLGSLVTTGCIDDRHVAAIKCGTEEEILKQDLIETTQLDIDIKNGNYFFIMLVISFRISIINLRIDKWRDSLQMVEQQ